LLLYSGGLDTSCILQWLLEKDYDVVAFIANLGQDEDFEAARAKATKIGASSVHVLDLRKDFLETYVWPALQCNAIYEGRYLLGTSLARPCIAKHAVEIANQEGCAFLSHGATGKGNDQVRFELGFYALKPDAKMVVPWRIPEFYERFQGRPDLVAYAQAHGIPVSHGSKPYSMDDNLMHISYESGLLEDPRACWEEGMFRMTRDPVEAAKDTPDRVVVHFERGVPVRVNNLTDGTEVSGSVELFEYLNQLAGAHGVGREDIVENRFIGMKSRGVYETPAGTVLRAAHMDLEGLTLDREVRRLRDQLAANFAEKVYNGFWFSPEMEFLLHALEQPQRVVTGEVELQLYRGAAVPRGRASPFSLYDGRLVSMDEAGGYDPQLASGFIGVNALRLKAHARLCATTGAGKEGAQ